MVDWSSSVASAHALYALAALMWLSIGVFGYDCCQYSSFDWSIVRGTRQRRWAHAPYLFAKVGLWSYLVSCLVMLLSGNEINCNGLMRSIEVQMGLVVVSCSLLLSIRAVCVYTGIQRKVVAGTVTFLSLVVLSAWLIGAGDIHAAWVPRGGNAWQEGACVYISSKKRYSVKYMITILFDLIVTALTVIGILRMNSNSRVGTILMRQGIQYFVVTFVANSLVAGLTLANLNPTMSLIGAIPSSTIGVICATRLFVNLSEEAKSNSNGVYLIQSTSSRGEKVARIFKTNKNPESQSTSAGETSTDGDLVINALSYGNRSIISPQAGRKSFGFAARDSDIEAQQSRSSLCIQITEIQTVTKEPMPAHLSGMLGSGSSNR